MQYRTVKGYNLLLKETSNIAIFEYIARSKIKLPKPPTYEDDNGRVLENPFHPAYHDALVVYDVRRHQVAIDAIIANCIELQTKLDCEQYRESFNIMQSSKFISQDETLEMWYMKNFVLEDIDMVNLVVNSLLTEQLVADIFNSIRVTRDGMDIHSAHLRNAIQTHIETDSIVIAGMQLVSPIDEIKAAQFSMINWQEWLRCELTLREKATAIALYRLDRILETHTNDVLQIHQEKEARKRNK